jgi:uncharacterized protein (DUF4415 family)
VPGDALASHSPCGSETFPRLDDADIDYSDIPETTDEQWKGAVRGPVLPLKERTITLALDTEVYEWLQKEAKGNAYLVNFVLKREAQRTRRNKDLATDRKKAGNAN